MNVQITKLLILSQFSVFFGTFDMDLISLTKSGTHYYVKTFLHCLRSYMIAIRKASSNLNLCLPPVFKYTRHFTMSFSDEYNMSKSRIQ